MKRLALEICLVFAAGLLLVYGLFTLPVEPAIAQANFTWPEISLVNITGGFTLPVHITHAGDDSGRLFVVEQAGRIRVVAGGQVLAAPFLDISDRVWSPASGGGSEEGLLSVAFPPGYGGEKDYFYVYYTRLDGNNQLSRFSVSGDPDRADAGSEEPILTFAHPDQLNHNGGLLTFGPQGYLYIGTGDGGGGGDPSENAQNPTSLLGKILRIDVEFVSQPPVPSDFKLFLPFIRHAASHAYQSLTYLIPPSNPFVGEPGYRPEIWALGLRNPWRYSFDRLTHDLYIADVGQNSFEEVNFQPASSPGGENYGWDIMEASQCYEPPTGCDQTGLILPVAEYPRDLGRSITGGFVYRGSDYSDLEGIYFYADFATGRIWGLQHQTIAQQIQWESQILLETSHRISTFGEDQSGELFLADYAAGEIYQVITP
ncbi:MAG TPA: PQQ-dependent sugar dehydrogenase [Anaerolineales bacterium]